MWTATILLVFLSCSTKNSRTSTMVSPASVQEKVDTKNDIFMNAMNSGNMDSLDFVYQQDSWVMPPNHGRVMGLDSIKTFMQNLVQAGLSDMQLSTEELHVINDANAIETGTYRIFNNDKIVDEGKFMVFWKSDGNSWNIYRDIWNSNMPAPQPVDTSISKR